MTRPGATLEGLPTELIGEIITHLDALDHARLRILSRTMYNKCGAAPKLGEVSLSPQFLFGLHDGQ